MALEDDDGFMGATLLRGQDQDFDASQYAFFGALTAGVGEDDLFGGLEDDVDAPPEEVTMEAEDEFGGFGDDDDDAHSHTATTTRIEMPDLGTADLSLTSMLMQRAAGSDAVPSSFATPPPAGTTVTSRPPKKPPPGFTPIDPWASALGLGLVPEPEEFPPQAAPPAAASIPMPSFSTPSAVAQTAPPPLQHTPPTPGYGMHAGAPPLLQQQQQPMPPAGGMGGMPPLPDDPALASVLLDPAIMSVQPAAPQPPQPRPHTLATLFNSATAARPPPTPTQHPQQQPPPHTPPRPTGPTGPGPMPLPSPGGFPPLVRPPQGMPYPPRPGVPPPQPPPGRPPPQNGTPGGQWGRGPPAGLAPMMGGGPRPRPPPMMMHGGGGQQYGGRGEQRGGPYGQHRDALNNNHHRQQQPQQIRPGTSRMSGDEIDHILRIQWRSLNQGGLPYTEDYYHMGYLYKHYGKCNRALFRPETVRNLDPTERAEQGAVNYVDLQGLGKLALSNIRRPRPLMDISASEVRRRDADVGDEQQMGSTRPLEQEPLLAARIMIEDCMCLLLDVDDIDRMLTAGQAHELRAMGGALVARRGELLDGLAESMHLADTPLLTTRSDDGVFLRLLALKKGCTLLAAAIRVALPPPLPEGLQGQDGLPTPKSASGLRIVWAALRNAKKIFSAAPKQDRSPMEVQASMTEEETQVTSRIAASLVNTLENVTTAADVASCIGALVDGDLGGEGDEDGGEVQALLPLLAPGQDMLADATCVWLGDVLLTLLEQAATSGLSKQQEGVESSSGSSLAWPVLWDKLFAMLLGHVEFLHKVILVAREGGPEQQGMIDVIRSMVPKAVMHKAMSFTTSAQRSKLRPLLLDMTH